jgi:hypothetical protein
LNDDPGKSPVGDETADVEQDDAPTRVRVVLMFRMAGKILAGPASPGAAVFVLPSHEMRAGQSIAASAKAIAAELLNRELGGGVLRGFCLVSPEAEEPDAIELYVAATADEDSSGGPPVVGEPWAFHAEREVTWSPDAARALSLPAGAFTAVDREGVALPVGSLAPAMVSLPDGPPPLPYAASASSEVYVLAAAITGGVAFVSGPIWALAFADVLRPELALVLWVGAIIGVFGVAAHGRQPRRVAVGGALMLPMGFLLCILAMIFGGGDGPHFAFWLWLLGSASLALAIQRLGTSIQPNEQQRVRRRIAWAAAALASLVAVFPPIRDTLFHHGDTATLEEGAPTPRALDDD